MTGKQIMNAELARVRAMYRDAVTPEDKAYAARRVNELLFAIAMLSLMERTDALRELGYSDDAINEISSKVAGVYFSRKGKAMHELNIGQLITHVMQRDAIHIAVAPVEVSENLDPGQPVEFAIKGNVELVRSCNYERAVGIIDPFLRHPIKPGESCWMFLKPNTITSLQHQWTHPAFEDESKAISEWWMREFADKQEIPYDELIQGGKDGEIYSGNDLDYNLLDEQGLRDFWHHFEIITGMKVQDHTAQIFRCAC